MIKTRNIGIYDRMYRELIVVKPDVKDLIAKQVLRFVNNPDDTRLDNHKLTKWMKDKWAFSITDDIRIVYEWLDETTARFLAIGPHAVVYGRKKND